MLKMCIADGFEQLLKDKAIDTFLKFSNVSEYVLVIFMWLFENRIILLLFLYSPEGYRDEFINIVVRLQIWSLCASQNVVRDQI